MAVTTKSSKPSTSKAALPTPEELEALGIAPSYQFSDELVTAGGGSLWPAAPTWCLMDDCLVMPWGWANPPGSNPNAPYMTNTSKSGEAVEAGWQCRLRIHFKDPATGEILHTEYLDIGRLSDVWPSDGSHPFSVYIPHPRGKYGLDEDPHVMDTLTESELEQYGGVSFNHTVQFRRWLYSDSIVFEQSLIDAKLPADLAHPIDYSSWNGMKVCCVRLPQKDKDGLNDIMKNRKDKKTGVVSKEAKLFLKVSDVELGKKSAASKTTTKPKPEKQEQVEDATEVAESELPSQVEEVIYNILVDNQDDKKNKKGNTPKSEILNKLRGTFEDQYDEVKSILKDPEFGSNRWEYDSKTFTYYLEESEVTA